LSQPLDTLDTLLQISKLVGQLLAPWISLIVTWLLLIVWIVWWLLAANWKRIWPVLAEGAWVPMILLVVGGALAWSQLAPSRGHLLFAGSGRGLDLPNFWWQLGDVGLLVCVALLCGWIQGLLGWQPPDINFEPATVAHDASHH
jgi:hypothetical protein